MTLFIHFKLPFDGIYKDLKWHINLYLHLLTYCLGYELAQLVDAMHYKLEVRGIDSCGGVIVLKFPVALWPWGPVAQSV